ncbi:DNA adenine methylase [Helicobacter sp. 13S00477-4]|uniref:DNA adenine methylase n=1 Tax=Helicobacter sp. 13S00477-4 TaxID=1905759 RepID=UPI0026BC4FD4
MLSQKIKGHYKKYVEVVNDINGDLINLHRIIQTRPESFRNVLNHMLCSRELFEGVKNGILKPRNDIERAAYYYFTIAMSFGGKGDHFAMCKKRKPKNIFRSYDIYSQRLRGVCIENMDFRRLIKEYDNKDTFFYADHPYVGTESYYKNTEGFGVKEHQELYTLLSNIKGKFILSYNDCEFIRGLYKDFKIESVEVRYTLNQMHSRKNNELLIFNF